MKGLPSLVGQQAEEPNGREARVQVKVEFLLAARLAVGEAGVLFGISDHKFDLIAKPVVPGDLLGRLGRVGRAEHHVALRTTRKSRLK